MGPWGIRRAAGVAAAAAALAIAQPASAATINVPCSGATGPVAQLVSAINTANGDSAADIINVTGGPCTFTLTAVAATDPTNGPVGLPIITQPLTINANGSTIARSTVSGTPAFRLLLVNGATASLALNSAILSGGSVSPNSGGAIAVINSGLTVDHTTFQFNAANAAGALYSVSSTVTVRRSAFFFNGAASVGASWVVGGTANFENDTFSVNFANNGLGGLAVSNNGATSGLVNLTNSTFADSSVTNSTNVANSLFIFHQTGTGTNNFTAKNTIFADTDSTTVSAAPCSATGGTIANQGGNFEFPTATCGFGAAVNPQLNALAANGGPTVSYLPKPGSPVINAGGACVLTTDQRDKPRPAGAACDSGSVEVQTPPETNATGPSGTTNSTTTTFTGTGEGTLSFQCSTDVAPAFAACTSPFTPSLPDGAHTISVRATDTYGNVDATPSTFSFTLDKTNPVVSITNKPPATITNNNPSLNFTVTDASTTTTTCKVDSAAPAPCSSPFAPTLADGSHTITVTATDAAGNTGSDSATFVVDTAPSQSINVACGDVAALRAAITAANATLAKDTIEVTGGPCTFTLNDSVDATSGGNGLPLVIHPLVVNGHGATIARNTAAGTPQFRIFFASNSVDPQVSLELNDLTISSGTLTAATPSSVNVGAGITNVGAALALNHVTLVGNVALQGAALWTFGGSVDIDHSDLAFNSAVIAGGIQATLSPLHVQRTALVGNAASSSVGAAEVIGSTSTFENTTFAANAAANGAAGLSVTNSTSNSGSAVVRHTTLVDSTRTGNTAPASALLTFQSSGSGTAHIDVQNSIVGDNDSTAAPIGLKPCDTSLGGTISDGGGNFEFPGNTCGFTHGATDPKLNAFTFTTLAYVPKPNSPVIDAAVAANCPATDQNDKARPDGDGCDSGSIETPAPETTLNGPPSDPTNDPTFTFTSDETPQLFVCQLDSAAAVGCTSPLTLPASVPDGTHTLTVTAFTSAFYVDPSPASVTFTLDRTAPVVHITNKPAAITADNSPSLDFTVDDANATVTCQVDSDPVVSPCSSPFVPGTLADGTHTITVSATDAVGNTGSDSTTFKVDTVPSQTFPVACGDVNALRAAITAANATLAADTIDVTGGPCTFTLNDSVDATAGGNGLPIVLHPLTILGHGSTITRNAASGTPAFRILFAFNQIDPNVSLELRDLTISRGAVASPNVGAGVAGLGAAIKLDNVTLSGNVAAQGGGVWTSGGSLDVDHSTIAFNQAVVAGGIETTNTASTIRRSVFALNVATSSGAAFVQVGGTSTIENDTFASNAAGNSVAGVAVGNSGANNGTATVSFSTFADSSGSTTAPGGALTTFVSGGTGTATIHVGGTIVTDTDSTAAATLAPCSSVGGGTIVDDGRNIEWPGTSCGFAIHADPQLAPLAANGGPTATYRIKPGSPAIDAGGTTCPSTDQRDVPRPDGPACDIGAFEVDAPDTTANGPASPTGNPVITFTSDQAGSTFQCKVDGGGFQACTSGFTPAFATDGSADGPHTVLVRAINAQGYPDPTPASVTFTYIAPIDTTITSGPNGGTTIYDAQATFTFSASKSPATFECRLDAQAFAACTSPKTVTGLTEGTHTFEVRAKDQFGNVDPTPASATFKYHHCLLLRLNLNGTVVCLI